MALKKTDLKVGMKVKMLDNVYQTYGYNKGDIVNVVNAATPQVSNGVNQTISVNLNNIGLGYQTKEEITTQLKSLTKEQEKTQEILEWMEKTGSETYSDKQYKVWKMLDQLDSGASKSERAKIITELLED